MKADMVKLVTFRLGQDVFAADIFSVERVLRYAAPNSVPDVPAWVEGVLTMPTYEIVMDTTAAWGVLPTLQAGFRGILADEGRHITFGTESCRILIEENPGYEALVHEIIDEYRGNAVGMLEYQRNVPGLDLDKYLRPKVRHDMYRCRVMGVAADETIIDQILDPSIDFVTGVQAG